MDKNWLIRTKSNHILGPVSKEKVVELYNNGSIKPDDEVCSGNGYWFFIREDDMVERFLLGPEIQGFNPISEAKDVLSSSSQSRMTEAPVEDMTLVGGINMAMLKPTAAGLAPSQEQASPPVMEKPLTTPKQNEPGPALIKKKNNEEIKLKVSTTSGPVKPLKKQNYLKYLGLLGFIVLFLLIYFRKTVITYIFEGEITQTSWSLFNEAHAQEDLPGKKKSS